MRALDTVLPDLAQHFGRSVGAVGMAVSAYALSYSLCQLIYGPWGDRVGPFRVIAWATGTAAIASMLCAVAPTLGWLVAGRFLAGGAAAAIGPLTLLWLAHATSPRERPVLIARMTSASILGTTGGQVGGGLVSASLSWHWVFAMVAVLFALAGAVLASAWRRQPRLADLGRDGSDRTGSAAVATLLRTRAVWAVLAAVTIEGLALYAALPFVAPLLRQRFAMHGTMASLLVGCFGVGGIAFVLFADLLVGRLSEARRAGIGGAMAGAGLLVLALGIEPLAAIALLVTGVGFFMLHNVLQVRATGMAPAARGAGVSLFAASFFLAQAAGAVLGGWCFDRLGGPALMSLSAAGLVGLGVAAALALRPSR